MNKKDIFPKTYAQNTTSDWLLMLNKMETGSTGTLAREVKESYLKSYFNLMYYMLFVPFQIHVDSKSGEYILKSNKIQKVLNLKNIYSFFNKTNCSQF